MHAVRKLKRILAAVLLAALLLCAVLLTNVDLRTGLMDRLRCPECPRNPRTDKWYSLSPEGATCVDGSPWRARIRFGDPDRLIIYLLGGGMVLDDDSQSRPYSTAGSAAFYYDNDLGVSSRRLETGLASSNPVNPFADWTILLLPYATGDFHVGSTGVHSGYANYAALMQVATLRLDTPRQLLITGCSAGGFGAAMLADDILAHFPDCPNVTLCVDGALLINDQWPQILAHRWRAPAEIADRCMSDNLTLDHLLALEAKHPGRVKMLFTSSTRDGDLAKFQSYIDGGAYLATAEGGQTYYENLCRMADGLQRLLPYAGLYIYDNLPYAGDGSLTSHTVLHSDHLFDPLQDGVSIADWMHAAVNGTVRSHGLDLLKSIS